MATHSLNTDLVMLVNDLDGSRVLMDRDDVPHHLKDEGIDPDQVQTQEWHQLPSKELAELVGLELESANYHELSDLPQHMLMVAEEEDLNEAQKFALIRGLGSFLMRF